MSTNPLLASVTALLFAAGCGGNLVKGSYHVASYEVPSAVESMALTRARTQNLNKAAALVRKDPSLQTRRLSDEEYLAIAAGSAVLEIVEKQTGAGPDGSRTRFKARIAIDSGMMVAMANRIIYEPLAAEYKAIMERYERAMTAASSANTRLQGAKDAEERRTALAELEQAERLFRTTALIEEGYKQYLQGQGNDALLTFGRVLEQDPDLAFACYLRARTYLDCRCMPDAGGREWFDLAIEDLDKALALKTELPWWAYTYRAEANVPKGQWDRSIEDNTSAIALQPAIGNFYMSRGNLFVYKQEIDKAIEDYTTAIKLRPDRHSSYFNRAAIYNMMGQFAKAVPDYTRAIELNPDIDRDQYVELSYYGRGYALLRTGEYERAVKDFTVAISRNESYQCAYAYRGMSYKALGRTEAAAADLGMACGTGDAACCQEARSSGQ